MFLEIRRQLVGVSTLPLPCEFWESISGHQTWQPAPLPTEIAQQPVVYHLVQCVRQMETANDLVGHGIMPFQQVYPIVWIQPGIACEVVAFSSTTAFSLAAPNLTL